MSNHGRRSIEEKPYQERSVQNYKDDILMHQSSKSEEMPSPSNKFWGPKRLVEVYRSPNQPLGIAIVGGKVDMTAGRGATDGEAAETVTGIFIKSVLPDSPAGLTGKMATGDRIVEVCTGCFLEHLVGTQIIQYRSMVATDILLIHSSNPHG